MVLVVFVQLENGFDRFPEVAGNLQGQNGGGKVTARLDGDDGIAAHAYGVGQLLLGDVQDGPFYAHCVFHRDCSFFERKSIPLNNRK